MQASLEGVRSQTIVVAEDEFFIRIAAVGAFEDVGFSVVEVANAEDAVRHIEQDPAGVLALFTDIHMPPGAMTGLDLAHHVHRSWPWIKMVLASGKALPGEHDIPPGSRFITKPYDLNQVIDHIRELVRSGNGI